MSGFDTIASIDGSGGNDQGQTRKKDAIWAAVRRAKGSKATVYLRNREMAQTWITNLAQDEIAAGRRLLLGFDFPFGYPEGWILGACHAMDRALEETA
ncbi:hypothetical protein [Oceaniovalibus sp. ACAM 378]|uniref:hypothetical protein n=1 Tax=Oceaniovalibus sp. ACAM 378 TaxID=2599923 RepID=UPI0011D5E15D|nr:hypothetical protein [Oceaniovalibus sp. ACAM 378]TYB87119.1 hypothetical protein FQ320_14910 [Oceaniovalibus sp. ACAM 378]